MRGHSISGEFTRYMKYVEGILAGNDFYNPVKFCVSTKKLPNMASGNALSPLPKKTSVGLYTLK